MRGARPGPDAAALWADIARPTRPLLTPGATMAGFRGRPGETVDLVVIPQPTAMLVVGFGDGPIAVGDRRGSIAPGGGIGALRAPTRAPPGGPGRPSPAAAPPGLGGPPPPPGAPPPPPPGPWGPGPA